METYETSEGSLLEEAPTRTLKTGLVITDLPKGTEFVFEEDVEISPEQDFFNREEMLKVLKHECLDDTEDNNNNEDDSMTPFERIAVDMIPLTEDRGVLKKELKPGYGVKLPEKAFVTIHYNAYLEYSDEPFDSSRLRDNPLKFVLDDGRAVHGIDIGVSSMVVGELSQFLIGPEYGYGKMGCPPRIPPEAIILYEVELLNFIDSAAAVEFEAMTTEEKKELSFKQMLAVCMAEHSAGNDFYKRSNLHRAITKYKKAARLMEDVSAGNDEEDEQRERLLLKLYLNISLCCLGLSENKGAITYARHALRLDPKNTKAHFRCGKALRLLGDLSDAKKHLKKAQRNEPHNMEINEELLNIAKTEQKYSILEKQFCKRAFQSNVDDVVNDKEELAIKYKTNEDFKSVVKEYLKKLVEDQNLDYIPFSSGFSPSDISCIKQVAQELGLYFVQKHNGQISQILVAKTPPTT